MYIKTKSKQYQIGAKLKKTCTLQPCRKKCLLMRLGNKTKRITETKIQLSTAYFFD